MSEFAKGLIAGTICGFVGAHLGMIFGPYLFG